MSHILRVLAVLSVVAAPGAALAQCTKDTDCKGDRVCERGACVSPDDRVAPPPPPAAAAPPAPRPPPRPVAPERAPDLTLRPNVLAINPLSTLGALIYGASIGVTIVQVSVLYERVLLPQLSVFGTLTPAITTGTPPATVGLTGGVRWYFLGGILGSAPAGLWAGGEVGILPLNFGPGLLLEVGYQFVLDSGLTLSATGGLVFAGDGAGNVGIGPGLGAHVGWNF